MVDITLFELHLDGAEFTANAPNSGVEEALDEESESESEGSGGPPFGLIAALALVALVGAAVAARRLGGEGECDESDAL
jgi:MYXO-CTERM domain-containing protein